VTGARQDLLWSAGVAGTALAVYLRTLAPGLVAILDTPMFQFIGRVLGVAHNPGYPLYVLLTFPFSYLPVGSLAYRINLFSAVCGALTVALAFLIARRLGSRRSVGAAAALGLAFGHLFWSQSIIAEVYTLDTALIAGMILTLLVWGETGRSGFFYLSVALLAAGLGNHTTILGFAPGMAIYAWVNNRAFVARARTFLTTALILCAGVLQYAFVLVRSAQPAAYVESPARSVPELIAVMSGRQFGDRLFAFGWREVVTERLPWLVSRVMVPELTAPGLALAAGGIAWLLWRRLPVACLVGGGVAATTAFTANYSVVDAPVFMIPATTMLWILAGVGAERTIRAVESVRGARVVAAAAMFALPTWLVVQNFDVTDRSRDRAAAITFDRLFEALPDRTSLVREDFLVDRMVAFKLLGEGAAGTRRIELVGRDPAELLARVERGEHVFGFGRSVRRLRYEGLAFSYAPLRLLGSPLPEHLSQVPDGAVVAIAVPAAYAAQFEGHAAGALTAIGADSAGRRGRSIALATIGIVDDRDGALVAASPLEGRVNVGQGDAIGRTGLRSPDAIEADAGVSHAAIRRGGREVARTRDGVVVALWEQDGAFADAFELEALDGFRVPVRSGALSVYRLEGLWRHVTLRDEWAAIDSVTATGSVMLRVAAGRTITLDLASASPLAPRVFDQSSQEIAVEITRQPGTGADEIHRIEARATGREAVSVLVALGGVPTRAAGRVSEERASGESRVYEIDTMGLLRARDRSSAAFVMSRDEQSQLVGPGWSAVDWDAISPFRWMTSRDADVLLPITRGGVAALRVQVFAGSGRMASLTLLLNGRNLGERTLERGWAGYEWEVPSGAAVAGTNRLTLRIDALTREADGTSRGPAVSEVRVVYDRP
jgi:hypothetical protein